MKDVLKLPVEQTYKAFSGMTHEEIGRAITALMRWKFHGEEPDFGGEMLEKYNKLLYYVQHPRRRWEDGVTDTRIIRNSAAYAEWRLTVFKRDGFRCQSCGKVGGKLNAHHIQLFSEHPALRLDPDNGITLCQDCHKAVHRGANNAEQNH